MLSICRSLNHAGTENHHIENFNAQMRNKFEMSDLMDIIWLVS